MQFRLPSPRNSCFRVYIDNGKGFSIDRHQKVDKAGFTNMIFGTFCILMAFSSLSRGGGQYYVPLLVTFFAIPYFDKAKLPPESQYDYLEKGDFRWTLQNT